MFKLPSGWVYGGPQSKDPFESTPCKCNTVVYSVLAACGICQIGNSNVKAIDAFVRPVSILESSLTFLPLGGRRTLATAQRSTTQRQWTTSKLLLMKRRADYIVLQLSRTNSR